MRQGWAVKTSAAIAIGLCAGRATAAVPVPAVLPLPDQQVLATLKPPLSHLAVSSPFGARFNPVRREPAFHTGVDYGAPDGAPVYAAQGGTVDAFGLSDRSGIYLRIRHSRNVETEYAHLHRAMPGLRAGSVMRAGDVIGFVGESGFATGPHLHFEVLVQGRPVDPQAVLARNVASAR